MEYSEEGEFDTYGVSEIYRQVLNILKDRGYTVEAEIRKYADMSENDFWLSKEGKKRLWTDLNKLYVKEDKSLQTIWIPVQSGIEKIKIDQLTSELRNVSPERNTSDLMFIADKPIGNPASNKLETLKGHKIEYWTYDRLRINIPEHFFIDRVEKLSKVETMEIMRTLYIKPSNFPILSTQDMTTRWYGFDPGDVIRIWRNREHIGRSVEYRMVVPYNYQNEPIASNSIFN